MGSARTGTKFGWFLEKLIGRVTKDPLEQRNFFWLNIANIGFYGAWFLCQNELLWTYVAKCGFSNQQIGLAAMYVSLANSVGMFVFMGLADRFKRRILASAVTSFLLVIQPLGILALLLLYPAQTPDPIILYSIIALSVTNSAIYALTWMLEMTVFVRTIRENARGRAWGMMGVVGAAVNILLFAQIARWSQSRLEPHAAVILCMAIGAACWIMRGFGYLKQRELPELAVEGSSPTVNPFKTMWTILLQKPCRALIYPQILRGATGAMSVFVIPYAVKHLTTPATFGSYMGLMGQVGLIAGSFTVVMLRDRLGSGLVVFIGDTMVAVGYALLFMTHSWQYILPVYAMISIGTFIENNAVPLGTFTIIPAPIMGAFSGVRMTIMGIASALASRFGGELLDVINPLTVFGIVAGLKVINAIWFWWVFTAYKPADPVPVMAPKPA